MKKRLSREERFPTKTDIKGIKRWLKMENSEKTAGCPFLNYKIKTPGPHWKCDLAFPKLIKKREQQIKELGMCRMCPCDHFSVTYVDTVARYLCSEGKNPWSK